MFIELFHGRLTPDMDMEDWGKPGPIIGPVDVILGTYLQGLRWVHGKFPGPHNTDVFVPICDDLIMCGDMLYGDCAVVEEIPETLSHRERMTLEEYKVFAKKVHKETVKVHRATCSCGLQERRVFAEDGSFPTNCRSCEKPLTPEKE